MPRGQPHVVGVSADREVVRLDARQHHVLAGATSRNRRTWVRRAGRRSASRALVWAAAERPLGAGVRGGVDDEPAPPGRTPRACRRVAGRPLRPTPRPHSPNHRLAWNPPAEWREPELSPQAWHRSRRQRAASRFPGVVIPLRRSAARPVKESRPGAAAEVDGTAVMPPRQRAGPTGDPVPRPSPRFRG